MSTEPEVTIETERSLKENWFGRFFYRKDGAKLTIVRGRLRFVAAAFLIVAYIGFIVQTAETKPQMKSMFGIAKDVAAAISTYIPPLLARDSPKTKNGEPPNENGKAKGKRKKETRFTGPLLVTRPKLPIPPGASAKAKLLTGGSNGSVRAELTESLQVNGEIVLAPGGVLVGTGSSTEDRLFIRFNQLIFKDGTFQTVQAQAFDPDDKLAGLKGSLLGNRAWKLAGSIGLNFVGGLSEGLQETEAKNGAAYKTPSLKNGLLNGASRAAIEASHDEMSQLRNMPPVIRVDAGHEIVVSFEGN